MEISYKNHNHITADHIPVNIVKCKETTRVAVVWNEEAQEVMYNRGDVNRRWYDEQDCNR